MLPSIEELNMMSKMDVRSADRKTLIDISTIEIEEKKSVNTRIKDYIVAIHNPFLVKMGDYVVKFSYTDDGESLDERMLSYVSQMTKIKG